MKPRVLDIMMGCLRLLLAVLVLLSHLEIRVYGKNPGVIAVVIFFIISGYATRHLFDAAGKSPSVYYKDRCIRILPSYFAVVLATLGFWHLLAWDSYFLSRHPGPSDWLSNVFVLPLNLFPWTGQDQFTIVPQAWSLALELQYYLLVPFVCCLPSRILLAAMALSMGVWLAACVGSIDPNVWGYRELPGTLFLFLIGVSIANRFTTNIIVGLVTASAVGAMLLVGAVKDVHYTAEEVIGLLIGTCVVFSLVKMRGNKVDTYLGGLSYPFFLVHFLVINLFEAFGLYAYIRGKNPVIVIAIVLASAFASILLYHLVERPVSRLRRRVRRTERRAVAVVHGDTRTAAAEAFVTDAELVHRV